jgi:HTH-type transcriptional regulator/antitoxin HigA
MVKPIQNQFVPDYAVPPGETLQETLESLGMNQAELARRTGRPVKTISEIINGKTAITPETAIQLERVLGVPASLWNNLERNYQEARARLRERAQLTRHADWAKQFPIKEMVKIGWINQPADDVGLVECILNYFGVASPEQWKAIWEGSPVKFRKSAAFKSDPAATAAWLRQGEIEAQRIDCQPFNAERFKAALTRARDLTVEPPETFCPRLTDLGAEAGVAVVFIRDLPRTRASGATRWLNQDKALIQLGLRHKANDHLWFTFFHEAGHILLHGKRDFFLENDGTMDEAKEREANRFAAELLIPENALKDLLSEGGSFGREQINRFAGRIGIAPGIVVGRLQHDGYLPPSHCNDLKERLVWKEI